MGPAYLCHHEVPGESDCVPAVLGGVVLPDGVLEELLGVGLGLVAVDGGQHDGRDLKRVDSDYQIDTDLS